MGRHGVQHHSLPLHWRTPKMINAGAVEKSVERFNIGVRSFRAPKTCEKKGKRVSVASMFRHWTGKGICWTRRFSRCFQHFTHGNKISRFALKTTCSITCMIQLYLRERCMLGGKGAVGCYHESYKYVNVSCSQGRVKCLSSTVAIDEHDLESEAPEIASPVYDIEHLRSVIKSRLDSVDQGDISLSPYDTAWVALVEDLHGGGTPQFPSSLKWIADNQLPDGSWGDKDLFSAYDRLLNTLACAIALRKWNVHPQQSEKGLAFVNENIGKLENEKLDHMTIGFEVIFPALMDLAQSLKMEVPRDSPAMQQIYAMRTIKLERIPRYVLHTIHTTLLFSLEAFPDLDWEKLLKLQFPDGSFLTSPSSTAFALAHTKDSKCLNYLKSIVEKFNGGVPLVYPVDLFSRSWAVDRLQRLGVARYFETELKEIMSYIYRSWTERGIYWTSGTFMCNLDETAMGLRLLRLYGYDVSADVIQHYKNGDEFFTFQFQSTEGVTPMFQLFRASQFSFPGEKILEDAKKYSYNFLQERRSTNQVYDKWLICKDLPGEVAFALDVPWYGCLPRVETRFYLEQYGGESDRWIGKVFYRMNDVNNNDYLELAKLDYNHCQAVHQLEWNDIVKWYTDCNLEAFGISTDNVLLAYFVAAACIFEPERSMERLAWAKTSVLIELFSIYFGKEEASNEERKAFVNGVDRFIDDDDENSSSQTTKNLMTTLLATIKDLSSGGDVCNHLCDAWKKWLMAWGGRTEGGPQDAQLIVRTIITCADRFSEEMLLHPEYKLLFDLTNKICRQLRLPQNHQVVDEADARKNRIAQVDEDMQELIQKVLVNSSDGIDSGIKQTFLMVSKSFYYRNWFSPDTIKSHIDKVLFEKVE